MTTRPDNEEPVSARPTPPAEQPGAPEAPLAEPTEEPSAPAHAAEPVYESPARTDDDGDSSGTSATTSAASTDSGQLMADAAIMDYSARWEAIQQGFVDDPRSAVTDADTLVGEVLQQLTVTFDEQRGELERQWSDGEPSTEDLRSALQRYRDFFQRLLAI